MSKPSWDEAPEWAKWLAQDSDGCWYWYEDRPILSSYAFKPEPDSQYEFADDPSNPDWENTIEERPNE